MAAGTEGSRRGVSTVEGESMLPTLRPGDEVIVELGVERIRCGDLVTLRDGGRLIVHRVIEAGPPILTRGDNAPRPDPEFALEQVLGRVVEVRRAGRSLRKVGVVRRGIDRALGALSRWSLARPELRRLFRLAATWAA